MTRLINLTGQTFGYLEVLGRSAKKGPRNKPMWDCICACNTTKAVQGDHLRSGHTQSCGCLHEWMMETGATKRTHGMSGRIENGKKKRDNPEYTSWAHMKQRCYNSRLKDYPEWGGRGISVCAEWYHSFDQFYADMGPKPSPLHSIDRYPDNNGNYEPNNCRWATQSEQNYNQRPRRTQRRKPL